MAELPVSDDAFREALAHFASGVTIVAAYGPGGPLGFTATAFASVSLDPPLVLVCVGKSASSYDAVVGAEYFGISVLGERQAWIAEQVARSHPDRFSGVPLRPGRVPLVDGSIATLECRPHARHPAGDHTILVGEVLAASVAPAKPLVHFARRLGGITAENGARAGAAAFAATSGTHASKGGTS